MHVTETVVRTAVAPVKLGLSAGELALEVTLGVVRGVRRVLADENGSRGLASPLAPVRPISPERRPVDGPAVAVVPPPPGAKQVDDDPVPVAEFGGKGAETAAGAQIHIDEPWDGYDGMTAAQIQKRLAKANRAVVAAVSLYEGSGRGRRSVIGAADRRLRQLSA